jgi:mannose-6-phosphate isomerase
MLSPRRVRPGNFTPPDRTPWGGARILSTYKAALALNVDRTIKVGESWEVSTEPSFPSVLEDGQPLADAIAVDPVGWLGREIAGAYDNQNPLLLKLIDPATTLSVQVHPPENHHLLAPDESGKTEAWIVIEADSGATIYLGFVDGVTQERIDRELAAGRSIEPLLNRIAVQPGDVFVIRPGLVHALGAGVTVVEPQRVRPGRRAVTYRLWDWNRTFDARGDLSPAGTPRPLHIRESLAVTDWSAGAPPPTSRASRQGASVLIDEPELFVEQYVGTCSAPLASRERMIAVMCLSGTADITAAGDALTLGAGETCVVPAAAKNVRVDVTDGRVLAACVQS